MTACLCEVPEGDGEFFLMLVQSPLEIISPQRGELGLKTAVSNKK